MQRQTMLFLTGVLLWTAAAAAQEQKVPPPAPTTVIRTETRVVLVDAVVTDKKNAYIHDLNQKDFKVWEDDKQQTITSFSFEADPSSNNDQKRYLVLFFDTSTMDFGGQQRARDAAGKFIDANAGPNRYMSVVNYTGTLRVAQNFTNDADRLRQVVKDPKFSVIDVRGAGAGAGGIRGLGGMGTYGARSILLALSAMAKAVEDVPGRKILVLFTGGFRLNAELQQELLPVISQCNRANVAIYPIDVGGLAVSPMGFPDSSAPGNRGRGRGPGGLLNLLLPGGGGIVTAAFMPQSRGGGTGTGSTGSSGAGSGGSSGAGSSGGGAGRAGGGGAGVGATGGTPGGGGSRGGGVSTSPGTGGGRSGGIGTSPNSGNTGRGGGGGNANMNNMNRMNNYNMRGREIIPPIPPFAGENQNLLYQLADGTGGFVIVNTNDLLSGLEKIGKEQNEYYLIGYNAPESAEGSCHNLRVKVDRGGLNVRARTGYCNVHKVNVLEGKPIEKELDTRITASEPGTITAPLQLPYFYTAANTARVDVAMEIPSGSVKFSKVKGKEHGEINILAVAYKPDASVGARFSDTVKFDLENKKEIEEFVKKPYHYDNQFDIGSGKYTFRVVFRTGGEDFGKLEKILDIPVYDGKQFSLSAIALSTDLRKIDPQQQGLEALLMEGRTPLVASDFQFTPSGTDQFQKTQTLVCYMEMYEPMNLDAPKPPRVGATLKVFDRKTNEQKLDSGMNELTKNEQPGNPVVPFGLKIPIADLAPGQYRLEVIAIDDLNKTAVSKTDFDIKP
jgi:VWFA-related protein